MFSPASALARPVTVMGKFTLAAPLELLLSAETTVANALRKAVEGDRMLGGGGKDSCDGRYLHRLQLCVLGLLTTEVHLLQAVTHKSEFYSVYFRKSLDPKLKFGSFG